MSERLDALKAAHDAMRRVHALRESYFLHDLRGRRYMPLPPSWRDFLVLTRAVDSACAAAMDDGHSAAECAAACDVSPSVMVVRARRVAQAAQDAQQLARERAEREAREERRLHEWVLRRRVGSLDKLAEGWRPGDCGA